MKKILNEWRQFLNESSLSRLYRHMQEHESSFLSASRGDRDDVEGHCTENAISVGEENKLRNRDLKAVLLRAGYGVTSVVGSYVENFTTKFAREVKEGSFFIVNLNDDIDFFDNMKILSEKYCQDSVLLCPKGGYGCFLYGTNNNPFPGFGEAETLGHPVFGQEDEFMSRVGGRPLSMKEDPPTVAEGAEKLKLETYEDLSRNQRMAVAVIAKRILKGN
tara:strand:- start:5 stop:661 length:657 start_codon:yes stop_codon:yes gene_type:complete